LPAGSLWRPANCRRWALALILVAAVAMTSFSDDGLPANLKLNGSGWRQRPAPACEFLTPIGRFRAIGTRMTGDRANAGVVISGNAILQPLSRQLPGSTFIGEGIEPSRPLTTMFARG
jgi:hypothetical protein